MSPVVTDEEGEGGYRGRVKMPCSRRSFLEEPALGAGNWHGLINTDPSTNPLLLSPLGVGVVVLLGEDSAWLPCKQVRTSHSGSLLHTAVDKQIYVCWNDELFDT